MARAIAAWGAVAVIACSSTTGVDAPEPLGAATVAVEPNATSILVGAQVPLSATVRDGSGRVVPGASVFWSSSDTSVATVTASGVVAARAVGNAQIAASANGASAIASLAILPVPVARVAVTPATASVSVGAAASFSAIAYDSAGAVLRGRTVVWASSNQQVASIGSDGTARAVSAGTATISATAEGKIGTAALTVTVTPVATVTVSPSSASLTPGQTVSLTATTRDANGNPLPGRAVSWSSSNSNVASVDNSGLVTARGGGTAAIAATSEGKSGTASVAVQSSVPAPPPTDTATTPRQPAPVARIVVSPPFAVIGKRDSVTFTATTYDANSNVVTGRAVTWASSDPSIVSVAAVGGNKAVARANGRRGSVTIVATSEGKSTSVPVAVQ